MRKYNAKGKNDETSTCDQVVNCRSECALYGILCCHYCGDSTYRYKSRNPIPRWRTDDTRTLDFDLYHSTNPVPCQLSRPRNEESGLAVSVLVLAMRLPDKRFKLLMQLLVPTENSSQAQPDRRLPAWANHLFFCYIYFVTTTI